MNQETSEPQTEQPGTTPAPPPPPPSENPVAVANNSAETVNSGGSDVDEVAQDIVAEIRDLHGGDKIEILVRLIQSRSVEVKLQRQLDVYQVAMETAIAEKTRLQLDLAYYNKMLAVLERGSKETKSMFATVSQQHADAVKMIEELDLKRTQFIKEEQLLKDELADYKQKFLNMQTDMQGHILRFESESRRYGQLQAQVEKMSKESDIWRKKLCDAETKQQSMVSAHSAQLNEMENLLAEKDSKLKDTQCRLDSERRTNTVLKEHTDAVLQEKTQLSIELDTMENRVAAVESELERKMVAADLKWQALLKEEDQKANEKLASVVRSVQELCSEKELLVAKLAQQKDVTTEMEGKLGGMQAILDDRNNEIFSLHSKLNCELKRFEEVKLQYSEGTTEAGKQLFDLKKETSEKDAKISRLEGVLRNQEDTTATLKAQIEMKDTEIKQLKEKIPNVDHYIAKIQQLETALADQTSKVAQLQQQQNVTSEGDKSVAIPIHSASLGEDITAQITSTPIHIELPSSGDEIVANAKKARVVSAANEHKSRVTSSPNYSHFQGSVQRKRTATSFFKRTAATEQVSITNASFSRIIDNMNLNVSSASTFNVDDEAMDLNDMSNLTVGASSIRYVKPFFRKVQDKK